MRRRVRTMRIAELTREAEVDDMPVLRRREGGFALVLRVYRIEQGGERRAEVVATPAAGTDVVDPLRLGGQGRRIAKFRGPDLPARLHSAQAQGLQPLGEASGVRLLGLGERLEPLRDLVEPLRARRLGETGVHLGELVSLALDSRLEVQLGRPDR